MIDGFSYTELCILVFIVSTGVVNAEMKLPDIAAGNKLYWNIYLLEC
jgi:hypothetical protein